MGKRGAWRARVGKMTGLLWPSKGPGQALCAARQTTEWIRQRVQCWRGRRGEAGEGEEGELEGGHEG